MACEDKKHEAHEKVSGNPWSSQRPLKGKAKGRKGSRPTLAMRRTRASAGTGVPGAPPRLRFGQGFRLGLARRTAELVTSELGRRAVRVMSARGVARVQGAGGTASPGAGGQGGPQPSSADWRADGVACQPSEVRSA